MKIRKETRRKEHTGRGQKRDYKKESRKFAFPEDEPATLG